MVKKKENISVLKNKIRYLEEELVRKEQMIEELKKENIVLFKTALKHSEKKVGEVRKNKAVKE